MGKASKRAVALKRKSAKRASKEALRAQYKAWAEADDNKRQKNTRGGGSSGLVKDEGHPTYQCTNVGCSRCHPRTNLNPGRGPGRPNRLKLQERIEANANSKKNLKLIENDSA
jgi:hypothetical protein